MRINMILKEELIMPRGRKAKEVKTTLESQVDTVSEKPATAIVPDSKKELAHVHQVMHKVKAEVPAREAVKAPEVAAEVTVQFSGKSYSTADLVKIARDVWKYDLGKEDDDFETVDLYVVPEENLVYYVINGEVKGDFTI